MNDLRVRPIRDVATAVPKGLADTSVPQSPLRLAAGLLLGLGLAALTLVMSAPLFIGSSREATLAMAWLFLTASSLVHTSVVLDARRGGVSLLLVFFFTFFIAVPSLVQVETGVFPFYASYDPQVIVDTYALLSGSLLFSLIGVRWGEKRTYRAQVVVPLSVKSLARFSLALLALCSVIAVYVGPAQFLVTRAEFSTRVSEGLDQQLSLVARSLSLLAAICSLLVASRAVSRDQARYWVIAILCLGSFAFLNYPPALPRFQLLGSILCIAAVFANFYRPILKLLFSIIGVFFLLFVFPAIKALGEGRGIQFSNILGNDVTQYLQRVDFDAFKQVADTLLYLENGNFRFGENLLGVVLFWVPRELWPSKPVGSGEIVSGGLGYVYTNVSSPLPAEGLISFGVVGVVIFMGVFGFIVGRTEWRTPGRFASSAIYGQEVFYILLIGFETIILRGALNSVAPMFMSAFVAYLALIVWTRARQLSAIRNGLFA